MKYTRILLCTTAMVCATAIADDTKPATGAESLFKALDKDSDGRLSQAEVAGTSLSSHFAALDTDSDGSVTEREFKAKIMMKPKSSGHQY